MKKLLAVLAMCMVSYVGVSHASHEEGIQYLGVAKSVWVSFGVFNGQIDHGLFETKVECDAAVAKVRQMPQSQAVSDCVEVVLKPVVRGT